MILTILDHENANSGVRRADFGTRIDEGETLELRAVADDTARPVQAVSAQFDGPSRAALRE